MEITVVGRRIMCSYWYSCNKSLCMMAENGRLMVEHKGKVVFFHFFSETKDVTIIQRSLHAHFNTRTAAAMQTIHRLMKQSKETAAAR
jgi:hypothetical protein